MFQNVLDNNVSSSLTRYHEKKIAKCWNVFYEKNLKKIESKNQSHKIKNTFY